MIELQHATAGRAPVVFVQMKSDSSRELGRLLTAAVGSGEFDVVVDLGDRADAPSDLLAVLHRAARQVRDLGGSLGVVAAQPSIRRLFDVTLLSRTLPIFATRDDALRARSS